MRLILPQDGACNSYVNNTCTCATLQQNKSRKYSDSCPVNLEEYAGADPGFPIGGAPTLVGGGANLRRRCFLVKTYVKMKEFGPVGGGGRAPETFVCRSATGMITKMSIQTSVKHCGALQLLLKCIL